MPEHKNIYTISASRPFLEVLAGDLYDQYKDKLQDLAKVVLILPTRRACRSFQEEILYLSNGASLILPKLFPVSDIDPYDLSFNLADFDKQNILEPIPAIKRQLYLVQLIQNTYSNMPYEQAFSLAQALSQLLDQIHTENLELNNLKDIIDIDEFSEHWQITLDFLEIISEHWPKILAEEQLSDPAQYRNQFIRKIAQYWKDTPTNYPVIFAGSTGTIPAVRELMKAILSSTYGSVILPGLDTIMDTNHWNEIEEGHPQAALKKLIEFLDIERSQINEYKTAHYHINNDREFISSALHHPTSKHHCSIKAIKEELENICLYDCDTPQEEAMTVSLIIREALESKDKTVALITPNRKLAMRVQQICNRWSIRVDDTAGEDLSHSEIGKFLSMVSAFLISDFDPIQLLSLLKHSYTKIPSLNKNIAQLEIILLRGIKNYKSFDDLEKKYQETEPHILKKHDPNGDVLELLHELKSIFNPVIDIYSRSKHSTKDCLRAHISLAENISGQSLWEKEYAEEAVDFISKLGEYSEGFPEVILPDYHQIFTSLLKTVAIRPKYGMHPRVKIYGLLEARMIQADYVIMGSLNEGMWPADAGHDPWMSRPMRKKYGLPSPERGITLSAHDFSMGFCQNEVYMTRALREDGTPTVASRWIQKLNVFLQSLELSFDDFKQGHHLEYSRAINNVEKVEPIKRPEPRPPLKSRPNKLSVTKIDMWRNDPYGLYASKILDLYSLDPIKSSVDVSDRGIILHEILQIFNEMHRKTIPDDSATQFLNIAKELIIEKYKSENLWLSWKARLTEISEDYTRHEKEWRLQSRLHKTEEKISCVLDNNFTLEARVDRIDLLGNSHYAIIDYKSGGQYAKTKILNGSMSQLPLEAYILSKNDKETDYIGYWKVTGSQKSLETITLETHEEILNSIEIVSTGLNNLISAFNDIKTPYYAIPNPYNIPRYNDYAYLERIKEWSALDEEDAA